MNYFSKHFARIFLIFIAVFLVFKVYFAFFVANGYPFGDWLINYQDGGFKRRGLLGTFVFFLYEFFHIKVQYTVFFLQFSFHFLFFYYLVRLIELKRYSILEFIFLFTPFCLWGFVSDSGMGARKDGVLWFMLSFFTYCLAKGAMNRYRWYFFYTMFFVSVFIHESFVFFFPCFIVLYYYHTKKIKLSKIVLIALSFCVPAVIIFLFGMKDLGSAYTMNVIKACGIDFQEGNIFVWKEEGLLKLDYYYKSLYDFSLYGITFVLQFGYVFFYLKIKEFKKDDIKKLIFFFFVCLFSALPLFLIAIDVGRWFYNLFIFWGLLIVSILPNREVKTEVFDYKIILSKKNFCFIVLIFVSNFLYRAPSCFTGMETAAPLRRIMHLLGYL